MSKLVTCPRCDGTGTIKWDFPKAPKSEPFNLQKFLETLGKPAIEKKCPEYITCPKCNGFGMVRG